MAFREGPFEKHRVPLTWTAGLAVLVAGAAAALMLIADRRDAAHGDGYGKVHGAFDSVLGPVNNVLAAPVRWLGQGSDFVGDYLNAAAENQKLKREISDLKAVRDENAALQNINHRYEALLNIRTEPPVKMVTARAVSESRGPFANARLIDTGAAKGVKLGNPVINEHGLVGRIVGAAGSVSRVLLLTDVASKTPVLVDRTDARAILAGDGSDNPKLQYLRGKDTIHEGDRILTSGDGGILPRGLPVGLAAKGLDGSWRVKLFSNEGSIDFVRVLLFEDFAQLARPDDLNPPPLASLSTAPPPSPELTAKIEALHPARTFTTGAPVTKSTPPSASTQATTGTKPAAGASSAGDSVRGAGDSSGHPAASRTPALARPASADASDAADHPARPAKSSTPGKKPAGSHRGPVPYSSMPRRLDDAPTGNRP